MIRLVRAKRGQRGLALVSVLWGMTALSLIAATLIATTRSSARLVRQAGERVQAEAAAEAGLTLAALGLLPTRPEDRWPTDATPRDVSVAGYHLRIVITDEAGKIDLNAGDPSWLAGLLQELGSDRSTALSLADAVAALRQPAGGQGAPEVPMAGSASLGTRARTLPFERVDDLISLPGMTPALLARAQPFLTVASQMPTVDTSVAAPEVLAAAPGLTKADVEAILAERRDRERRPATLSVLAGRTDLTGRAFTIAITVAGGSDVQLERRAVLRLTGARPEPWWILSRE